MNDTLYKLLEPTKTIEESMPRIIEAFVTFYGEENRAYIEEKFKNLVVVGYGLPERISGILYEIKKNKTNELKEKFFEKAGIKEGERDNLESLLFSSFTLAYPTLMPLNNYVAYLESNKKDEDIKLIKERAVQFLKKINPNVTEKNIDKLIKKGAFKEFDQLVPFYKEMLEEFKEVQKKLEEYEKISEEYEQQKNKLSQKCWLDLLEEFSYLFPKEEIELVTKNFKQYGYISTTDCKKIDAYLGSYLKQIPLIAAFSEENNLLIIDGSEWKQESIIYDRIGFFKAMGIDLGDDYQSYINNEECKKLIPSEELIEKILKTKEMLVEKMMIEYFENTKEYKENRKRIESYQLINKNDEYNADAYIKNKNFISPNIIREEKTKLFPLMCINIHLEEYLDKTVIHELNHAFELELVEINENGCVFNCGWDRLGGKVADEPRKVKTVSEKEKVRKYELFSEIINELICQEITNIMHDKGIFIFNTKDNFKIKGGTAYEHTLFLVSEFYNTYKKEIIESRKSGNIEILFDRVGKENFEALNNLFHIFDENLGGLEYYDLIESLNKDEDTELTRIFYDLIIKRDNILENMKNYNNNKKNQK
ncbi:MAG: hypothetical protein IKL65_01290 [Bacilli bacterium]|nr:hypothetical protein [Bacilli bacterium]